MDDESDEEEDADVGFDVIVMSDRTILMTVVTSVRLSAKWHCIYIYCIYQTVR